MTRDTVWRETPARFATSRIVGRVLGAKSLPYSVYVRPTIHREPFAANGCTKYVTGHIMIDEAAGSVKRSLIQFEIYSRLEAMRSGILVPPTAPPNPHERGSWQPQSHFDLTLECLRVSDQPSCQESGNSLSLRRFRTVFPEVKVWILACIVAARKTGGYCWPILC